MKNRRHVKVPHNARFEAEAVKEKLGLMDRAWSEFITKVRKMSERKMAPDQASSFFEELLFSGNGKKRSNKTEREHQTLLGLFKSAPGQEVESAKGTLWGAVNAVSYYADHVRGGIAGERLNSAWFGAGSVLKEKAWEQATSTIS